MRRSVRSSSEIPDRSAPGVACTPVGPSSGQWNSRDRLHEFLALFDSTELLRALGGLARLCGTGKGEETTLDGLHIDASGVAYLALVALAGGSEELNPSRSDLRYALSEYSNVVPPYVRPVEQKHEAEEIIDLWLTDLAFSQMYGQVDAISELARTFIIYGQSWQSVRDAVFQRAISDASLRQLLDAHHRHWMRRGSWQVSATS